MKAFNAAVVAGLILTSTALFQGCALLVVGGAAYGGVSYVSNTLTVTLEVTLDRAFGAATATLKQMQIPIITSKKDAMSGRLEGRNIQDQPVNITLTRKNDHVTQIEISVGTFDTAANHAAAQQVYDQMRTRF